MSTRPGRLDRFVYLGPLDEAGRKKIAGRILKGWEELQEKAILDGVGETGAQFEQRCGRMALSKFWEPKT